LQKQPLTIASEANAKYRTVEMKVVHVFTGPMTDGAARGAYWLHLGLKKLGVDSTILTSGHSPANDTSIVSLAATFLPVLRLALLTRLSNLPTRLYRNRQSRLFNTGFLGIDFTRNPSYRDANVVHLHWVNGLVGMRTLRKIVKPVIWTMRDMWPMTGGCHYAMECERYRDGCGRCPQLGSRHENDLTRWVVKNKKASLPKHIRMVGISHWLSECAEQSCVFRGFPIATINNNVDTEQFFPLDQFFARIALKLPGHKKIVLVGSHQITEFYKGFALFLDSLETLDMTNIHVVIFGNALREELSHIKASYTYLGFLFDAASLRLAYSAADVFVAPSRMDAFGKTIVEAMACGCPVVCFDATGPRDIVVHQVTGYKAAPFESSDLGAGIQWVLSRSAWSTTWLRAQARKWAQEQFDSSLVAQQYLALYERLVAGK